MKYCTLLLGIFIIGMSAVAPMAHASGFTISASGDEDSARFTIGGVPNASVTFHYTDTDGDTHTLKLGTADDQGYLSKSVDADDYDVDTDEAVYVTASGLTSRTISWPRTAATTGSNFSLNIDAITVVPGKTKVVLASDLGKGALTVSGVKSSVAKVSADGAQISVTGVASGTTNATLCLTGSSHCAILSITVGQGTASAFSLSNMTPIVVVGTTTSTVITGASSGAFYISDNSKPSVVQVNIISTDVVLLGIRTGTSDITLCKTSNACVTFTVTVVAKSAAQDGPVLSSSSVAVSVGETKSVSVGGIGGYSLSGSSNKSVASATLGASLITVKGLVAGTRSLSVCDSSDECTPLRITVSEVAAPVLTPPAPPAATTYQFTTYLERGNEGAAVMALQNSLKALGFLTATPNGYFGPATEAAVKAFQTKHGISAVGYVGPATRAALNGG